MRTLRSGGWGLARQSETAWWGSALLVIVALALTDALLGAEANLSATFAIAPFLAATGAKPRQTAAVAAVASAASVAFSLHDKVSPAIAATRWVVVFVASVLAVLAAQRRFARERRLSSVIRVAEIAQQAILVPVPPRLGAFAFASAYISATEEARLGGDFYEVVETPQGIRLILGDVRGKGVEAVHLAALVLRYFRDSALTNATMEDTATALDHSLVRHLGLEEFVTALLVQLDGDTVEIVNCGHHPPAVVTPEVRWVEAASTTPLGLEPIPSSTTISLSPGDRVVLYTDGLVEARQSNGEFVPVEELVATLVDGEPAAAVRELLSQLHARVGGHLADDLAVLLIEYTGQQAPADPPLRSLSSSASSNRAVTTP